MTDNRFTDAFISKRKIQPMLLAAFFPTDMRLHQHISIAWTWEFKTFLLGITYNIQSFQNQNVILYLAIFDLITRRSKNTLRFDKRLKNKQPRGTIRAKRRPACRAAKIFKNNNVIFVTIKSY
jgi:hypothetical protein